MNFKCDRGMGEMRRKSYLEYAALVIISMFFLEDLYTPNGLTTGVYAHIICILLILIMTIFYLCIPLTRNTEIYSGENRTYQVVLFMIVSLVVLSYFFKGGSFLYAVRYTLTPILIYLSLHIKNFPLSLFSKGVIVVGTAFSIFSNHTERIDGFLKTSPTLFALLVLTACIYIFENKKSKSDMGYILIGLILIYFTGTRSTLVAFFFYLAIKGAVKYILLKSVASYSIFMAVLILIVFSSFFAFKQVPLRENQSDSTKSRIVFIEYGIQELEKNPTVLATGYGAGHSMDFLHSKIGVSIPLHFDPLSYTLEYGLVGMFIVIFFPILLGRFSWQGWLLYMVGWFHNLLLFPIGVFYIFQVGSAIWRKNNFNKYKIYY